jgi:hypothetical protein
MQAVHFLCLIGKPASLTLWSRPVTDQIMAPIDIFAWRVSSATGSSNIGRTHKSCDAVELNLTPSTGTGSHLYFGAARYMADHTKRRAGACAQNGLVSDHYCSCVRKPGCDDKETGAEHNTRADRHFFFSLTVIRTHVFSAPTRAGA